MDGCENGNTVQTMWPTREDFSNKKKNRREITAWDAGDRIIDLQLTQKAVPQCFGKNGAIWLVKNVYEVCRQFNILYDRYFGSVVDLIVIAKWPSINNPPAPTHTHTMWQISLRLRDTETLMFLTEKNKETRESVFALSSFYLDSYALNMPV